MARSTRIQVTVTPEMSIALGHLAGRTGLTVSTQATVLLRQALDRTIKTAVVQGRYRQYKAQRNHAGWQEDTVVEHAVEGAYAAFDPAVREEIAHSAPEETPGRAIEATSQAEAKRRGR